jgi:hypothetical protein
MSYPTTLQCIKRKGGYRQFYLNIPAALAEALDCQETEVWRWSVVDRKRLLLERAIDPRPPRPPRKKG